jgi:hypothetical protein
MPSKKAGGTPVAEPITAGFVLEADETTVPLFAEGVLAEFDSFEAGADCVCAAFVIPHERENAILVCGPTAPYPVVFGEPDATMPFDACHACTAASVC